MVVPHTLPSPDGGHGCPVMSWAMLEWLKRAGHDVSLFAFAATDGAREPNRVRARQQIADIGVELIEPTDKDRFADQSQWQLRLLTLRRLSQPQLNDYFAAATSFRPQFERAVDRTRPDALWLYTTDAAALAARSFPHLPRLASLVDLDHEARELKRVLRPRTMRHRLRNTAERWQDRRLIEAVTQILKSCEVVVEHSLASAEWLRGQGINAHYLPNPVRLPELPPDWFERREAWLAANGVKRILMVGHLRGVATQTGLHLLADEILPALIEKKNLGAWEVHIVGGGELTPELKAKLWRHPRVRLRGFVADLAAEYQQAHVNLVAVSERIGFRTRLVEAFHYGAPSIVHTNNQAGMPELDGENALLADAGRGLADALARTLRSDELRRRLERSARRAYEDKLHIDAVMNRMMELLAEAVPHQHIDSTAPESVCAHAIPECQST